MRTSREPDKSERFFYHSFPRRGRNTSGEIDKGCKILALICDAGLVLAPEVVPWSYPHADGKPPRQQQTIQRRICFTELAPGELKQHAEEFGHFALEFEVDTLKRTGAMPVFYIPQATSKDPSGMMSLGSTLVVQSIDAMLLAMRLAGIKHELDSSREADRLECTLGFQNLKTFSLDVPKARETIEALTYALTPPAMLEQALTGLINCFYPADNLRDSKALAYYRQREWRIAWNFAIRNEEVMRRPSDEVVARLLAIDPDFFGRDFETASGKSQLAREAWILPGLGGKRVIDMVNRIVVPRAARASAQATLTRAGSTARIVCIEQLA